MQRGCGCPEALLRPAPPWRHPDSSCGMQATRVALPARQLSASGPWAGLALKPDPREEADVLLLRPWLSSLPAAQALEQPGSKKDSEMSWGVWNPFTHVLSSLTLILLVSYGHRRSGNPTLYEKLPSPHAVPWQPTRHRTRPESEARTGGV